MPAMSPSPRRCAAAVWGVATLGLALIAFDAAPGAAASARQRSCGLVAVRVDAKAYHYWSMNRVHASGVACAAARGLVRDWAVALAAGRIPAQVVFGAVNAHGVIVWGAFGPAYRFEGYTCRWANVKPGPHAVYQPGGGRCRSGGAVVSWSFHGALNPTLGQARGCPGTVTVGPASATTIRTRAMTCARAKRMIRYLLTHRLIRPAPHRGLRLVRRRVLGFRLFHQGLDFRARRGQSRFSFVLYWLECGC
jgi:hypothetical protein